MKPDWKDAPEWANYLAQYPDGYWFWYEVKPYSMDNGGWYVDGDTRYAFAGESEREPEERP